MGSLLQLSPGQIFATKYRVVDLIKAGGMGAVYQVRHTENDKRWALKLMHPDLAASAEARERFAREAKIDGIIDSSFVVSVIDAGLDEATGMPFLVMEYLDGEELGELLRREGALPPKRVVAYLDQVARALDKAHAKKIVHRDLKPENLFLCRGDDGEKMKVLDFGIAKLLDGAAQRSTQGGGTPLYMAPEQTRKNGPIGPQTDVYALGLIAYALLVGRTYREAETIAELLGEIVNATGAPREAASVRAARAGVTLTGDFDRWFARATNDATEARFASAGEAIGALAVALGLPPPTGVLASAPTVPLSSLADPANVATVLPDRLPPPKAVGITTGTPHVASVAPRRTASARRWWALGGLVALVAVGVGVHRYQSGKSPSPSPVVVASGPSASTSPLRTPEVGLHALESFRSPKGAAIALLDSRSFWDACAQDFHATSGQTGAPARWAAGDQFCTAQSALVLGDVVAAADAFRRAVALDATWSAPPAGLAIALVRQGKVDEALTTAREAERLDPSWVGAIWTIARVQTQAGHTDDAIQEYRRALALAPQDGAILGDFALVLHASRLDGEADRYAKQALEVEPELVSVHVMLAERALETRDANGALEHATRALASDPNSAPARLAEADALSILGRKEEAMYAYRQTLKAWDARHAGTENESRIAVIRTAVDAGKLPPQRKANTPEHVVPRTACAPGDPLCVTF